MNIQEVTGLSFRKYGNVLEEFEISKILKEMEHTPLPKDVIYVPSVQALESLEEAKAFQNSVFGGLPIHVETVVLLSQQKTR